MKKHLSLAGFALLASAAVPAFAATTVWFVPGVVELRAGPHQNFPIVATAPSRENMTLVGCLQGYTWCDVSWNGMRGWVSGDDIASVEENKTVTVTQVGPRMSVPITTYKTETYWDSHYRESPFYSKRQEFITWTTGPAPVAAPGASSATAP